MSETLITKRIEEEEVTHPRRLERSIPRDLETVELSALQKEPSRRYQTAEELADAAKPRLIFATPEAEVDAYIAADAQQHGVPPAEQKATLAAEEKLDAIRHAARLTSVVDEMIRRAGGGVD